MTIPPQAPPLHTCEQHSALALHIAPSGAHIIAPVLVALELAALELVALELAVVLELTTPLEVTVDPEEAMPPWEDDDAALLWPPPLPPLPPDPPLPPGPGDALHAMTTTARPIGKRKTNPVR